MAETTQRNRTILSKLGLKILAFLLGIMSWYLIQDAIRIENSQRKAPFVSRPATASTNSVVRLVNLPVTVLSKPGLWEWRLDPQVVSSVWLEGDESDLHRVDVSTVRVFVDGSVIAQPGDYAMPVRVYLPSDLGVKAVTDPALVRLTIKPALKGSP